jgi:plastocyanin
VAGVIRLATVAAALALGAALVAGCGSKDKGPTRSTTAASGTVAVTMKSIQFMPHDVTVKAGQRVRWTNDDNVPHTVTATKNASFDSGTLKPGAVYETTMRNAGQVEYVCLIHPGQTGTITIVP